MVTAHKTIITYINVLSAIYSKDTQPYRAAWRVQGGLLRERQYWKVERLRKLPVASGDYCKGKASFLDSHSQSVARRPRYNGFLVAHRKWTKTTLSPSWSLPLLPGLCPSFDFKPVMQQVSVAWGNLSAEWIQGLALPCFPRYRPIVLMAQN